MKRAVGSIPGGFFCLLICLLACLHEHFSRKLLGVDGYYDKMRDLIKK